MAVIDIDADKQAQYAYARIRGDRRPGDLDDWPMSHWDDLDQGLRRLLILMWTLGCDYGGQAAGAGPSTVADRK